MRKVRWIASSRADLHMMASEVRKDFGKLITRLQAGETIAPPHAKPLGGYLPVVTELIKNHDGNTYRAVVTVKLDDAIYVLHVFKKKSTHGIGMTKQDQDLIARRLREAVEDHEARRREKR